MKISTFLLAILMILNNANAEEPVNSQNVTALYMISPERDWIGQGKVYIYLENQSGQFSVRCPAVRHSSQEAIAVKIKDTHSLHEWECQFGSLKDQSLQPGLYKMAQRFRFNEEGYPGLSISGEGRGCNKSSGEFEILEIKYDDQGKIESFAANFLQQCEGYLPPLSGTVRYNSTIPIESRFKEYVPENTGITVYLIKYDPSVGMKEQPMLISQGEINYLSLRPLPYGEEGIEVCIDDRDYGSWILGFAARRERKFTVGLYKDAEKYPFQHSNFTPAIEIITPEGRISQPTGDFEVLELRKGVYGEIQALAMNFLIHSDKGEVLEGAIRFNSKTPINLEHPHSH
jgi:hypothetical protein